MTCGQEGSFNTGFDPCGLQLQPDTRDLPPHVQLGIHTAKFKRLQVYIDIGAVGADKDGQPPPSYGTLLRPTEEGRVGDRVARAARFMGTYQEFKAHCRDLPGLVRPHVALWADVTGHQMPDFWRCYAGCRGKKL